MKLTIARIAELVDGEILSGAPDAEVVGVSIDTRTLEEGNLFVALKGEHADGHSYVNKAVKAGAAVALVSRREAADQVAGIAERKGTAFVLVDDTLKALHDLARGWLEIVKPRVVGITGSTGKTSTKELMAATLGQRFRTAATPENENNEIGVPLTALRAAEDTEVLIVEMGMRGRGQIAELCDIVNPEIGVVTSIGPSHIELLGSVDEIIAAKSELLKALPYQGLAVIEAGKPYSEKLEQASNARVMTVGVDLEDAKVMATHVTLDSSACASAHVLSLKGEFDITLGVPGLHQLTNALMVVAVAQELGIPSEIIEKGLEEARVGGMRFKMDINAATDLTVINDAYNANPNSMEQAVRTLASLDAPGRRICVIGDMLELGDTAPDEHRAAGAIVAHCEIDYLFAFGDYATHLLEGARLNGMDEKTNRIARAYDWIELDLMLEELQAALEPGDIVLVKASRGMELERVADVLLGVTTVDEVMAPPAARDPLFDQTTSPLDTIESAPVGTPASDVPGIEEDTL
ncbi:MAG: UDP-N-acetylmuramoyl-tripeptide--D-alanyl-D-alanine ligase [Coriobacteriia bacterium]|nr:UDP-N-acetylmuramoyl-tripeptide--D-alanyl-D-alanine ligase [Coriobacteriia bacterium]